MKIIKKVFKFESKSFEENDEFFMFEGYLSTFGNVDRGGDVVVKGAFIESLKVHEPPLFFSHKSDEPVGVFDALYEDDIGLYVKGRMPKSDSFVSNRIIPQMRIGSLKYMSIGFGIDDWASDTEMIDNVRFLKKVTLWEGSLVTIPMNPEAEIKKKSVILFQDDLPIADRQNSWDSLLAIGRLREWSGSENDGLVDPAAQALYKKAFLWYDEDYPEFFDSYELPIADVIDGKLIAIPKAIFKAAAIVKGGRAYVWNHDVPTIMRTIEKYFNKMGIDSPFEKSAFRIDDFSIIDEKILEKLFKTGIRLSSKNSKMLVSFVKSGLHREDAKDKDDNHREDDIESKNDDWSEVFKSIKSITTK